MSESAALNSSSKRKRSESLSGSAPLSKKTTTSTSNGNQLQINYLARQCADDVPFISKDDTLPNLLEILTSYNHVLDRQESLASNLGARPLGPILIKRFERCFDAPPKIIASHSHAKGTPSNEDETSPTVTWLDVVHFAQAHPGQFALATFSEGRRVCQFYYPQKQVRVQVSEEDFLFINSGRCQDLIPPLPIWEDEEKEVGTCEILEKALRELTNAADMVAARTRQLGHRLKGRRMAIQERRSEQGHAEADTPPANPSRPSFVASNSSQVLTPIAGRASAALDKTDSGAAIRSDLLKHFQSLPHNQNPTRPEPRRPSLVHPLSPVHLPTTHHTPQPSALHAASDLPHAPSSSVSPAPTAPPTGYGLDALTYYIESNPTSNRPTFTPANFTSSDNTPKHNFSRPLPPSQESSQPYRAICQAHMESLPRGSRVLPPCDRCRRLRMDCLKNLSSCAGCTKKHARCHWKEVRREEVLGLEGFEEADTAEANANANPFETERSIVDTAIPRRLSGGIDSRRLSEEHQESANGAASIPMPPLPREELEKHAQASINEADPSMPAQSIPIHQAHQQADHHNEETRTGAQTFLSNQLPRRPEGDESRQAMDLLRLLSREATNAATSPGAGSGARTNGAFRSVYNPHGPEPGPSDGQTTAASNGSGTGLGVGISAAGGDRL